MYYIFFCFLYPISLLPWRILYVLSDLAFIIIYHIIGYRKEVVADNLLHAFPEKTEAERKRISKKFYQSFCDNWIETIKLLSVSKENLSKRLSGDVAIFHELHATGRSLQGNFGHFFNWEILNHYYSFSQPYTILGVYFPLKNQVMDRLMKYLRARRGIVLIPLPEMARAIIPWRKKQYFLALIGDQSPAQPNSAYWLNFMNRPTCFIKGPEKFARGQDIPVTVTTTRKIKRGHYHFETLVLTDSPTEMPDGEVIRRYVKHLEENIRLQPELYLWSHRRWKHNWKPEYEKLWVDTEPLPKS
ncbi:MAG: lysophospholipid acyltransferase family protein [Sediminibacterium sp.]